MLGTISRLIVFVGRLAIAPFVLWLQTVTQEPVMSSGDWIWRIFNSAGVIAAIGLVTQYVLPKLRKAREKADTAQIDATTAKTKAEASQAQFAWYEKQLTYLQDRVDDMETKYNLSNGLINAYRTHTSELYMSIRLESPEAQTRMLGRVKSKRPNGGYTAPEGEKA
jgi:hypothetical protein